MKITPDQLAALLPQQKKISQNNQGDGFARFLTQEMQSENAAQPAATALPVMPQPGIDQVLQASMLHTSTERTIMDKMDTLLAKWENYSQTLAAPQGDLRAGYRILDEIRSHVRDVKGDASIAAGKGDLDRMIEELDILAVTEEFKFNRGDYMN
ncbi:MAG: hypothetical protein Q4B25_02125 [Pseudomonadota bacterium]|nr:hypothetical protein [Pseudomonadota bacterium]